MSASKSLPCSTLPKMVLLYLTTTGPTLLKDQILEVSLASIEKGQMQEHWYRIIEPESLSSSSIFQLGITTKDLDQAISIQQLQSKLDAVCEDQLVVGFGLREQLAFLRAAGIQLKTGRRLCLQKAVTQLEPSCSKKQAGLLELADYLKLVVLRPWRAPDRLLILWQLFLRWQKQINQQLPDLLKQQYQERLLPVRLKPEQLNRLPDTPGVYLMYPASDSLGKPPLPLYIGKSIHLRTRVKSHFSADQRSSKALRIAQKVQALDWVTAAGDLGAQLKEAQLIKQFQPLLNRRLRRQKKLLTWWQHKPGSQLKLEPLNLCLGSKPGQAWGIFTTARQARKKLEKELEVNRLCPSLLGMQDHQNGQACFNYQLGRCQGACCGKESQEEHQKRLEACLKDWQFHHWPWKGAVLIEEKGAGGKEYHSVNSWQYLGSASTVVQAWKNSEATPEFFDPDTYRLLKSVLQDFFKDGLLGPMQSQATWQGSRLRILIH
ncbi:DNA polymerase-3 subunit epsilon [Marinospirillum celere]|uniref:Excinuclease cho n=2 Tax=Marinospirillum celere TaxID=1122252 RepID=A0A1I1DWM4_9GAMM|nr:DNA polymerase-3 subunit epsilon [Marinospirillum celere]